MTSMPYPKPLTARDIAAHTPALKKIPAHTARVTGSLAVAVLAAMLAGCASQAPDISLIPTQTDAVTSQDGLFVQPVKFERTKPDCRGDCPRLSVDSVVFPGVQRLTDLVDHALAMMTGVGEQRVPPYATIAEFEQYFWKTAGPRDEVMLAAKARYRNRYLTVIELNSGQYFTGAAHGITTTQFLNWDNANGRVLDIDDIFEPGGWERFVALLEQAHRKWVNSTPEARDDPEAWLRLWPFQPTTNIALVDSGVVAKYGSYEIAPYSSGQPELRVPYSQLTGILKPQYLPN